MDGTKNAGSGTGRSSESHLRVIVFQEDGVFAAVCLEHYVTTQGRTLEHLRQRIERLLRGYLALSTETGDGLFSGIEPAPPKYFAMYEMGEPLEPIVIEPAPEVDLRRVA
jgi:predicted RNase H-like HicB family nuclease